MGAKHFKCMYCRVCCESLDNLIAHGRRVHYMEIDKVPGAVEGRQSPTVFVLGMEGVPVEDIDATGAAQASQALLALGGKSARVVPQPRRNAADFPPLPQPVAVSPGDAALHTGLGASPVGAPAATLALGTMPALPALPSLPGLPGLPALPELPAVALPGSAGVA